MILKSMAKRSAGKSCRVISTLSPSDEEVFPNTVALPGKTSTTRGCLKYSNRPSDARVTPLIVSLMVKSFVPTPEDLGVTIST